MKLQQNKKEKSTKITSLQALRAVAFLGICTSHCRATALGAWGVSVFIILSGFVMYLTYKEKSLPDNVQGALFFSIKKIWKLYPLHILTMLSALVFMLKDLLESFTIKSCIFDLGKVVLNIFLLQDWVPSASIYFSLNGVAWYLSLCLFLYFAFPFLMKWIRRIKSNKEALITIFVIYGAQILIGFLSRYLPQSGVWILDNTSKWIIYILPLFRLGDFTIGCCLCYLYFNLHHKLNTVIYSFLEIVTLLAIIGSEYIYKNQVGFLSSEWFRYTMLYTLSSCAIVYLFAMKKGFITNIATNKFFIYLGNISAFTFLMHQMIIRYFDRIYGKLFNFDLNVWIKSLLILLLTILGAQIYSAIETRIKEKILKSDN